MPGRARRRWTRSVCGPCDEVSILAQPEAGRCSVVNTISAGKSLFQSSPSPKLDAARDLRVTQVVQHQVSILTQPAGWALLDHLVAGLGVADVVSILAQPEGWALPSRRDSFMAEARFQSSPSPKAGRCGNAWRNGRTRTNGFNPRPARRLGAAKSALWYGMRNKPFQSSPSPKAGRCV